MKLKLLVTVAFGAFLLISFGTVVASMFIASPSPSTTEETQTELGDSEISYNNDSLALPDPSTTDNPADTSIPTDNQSTPSTPAPSQPVAPSVPSTPKSPTPICGNGGACTRQQVAVHNKPSDCWVIVSGKVYNISSFANSGQHRKSSQTFTSQTCGADITAYFFGQDALAGVGKNNHSTSYLTTYGTFIGNLQ